MNTTACRSLLLTLLAVPAAAATSGCSQVLYPHRPIHRPFGMVRPLPAPVQPEWAARGRWDAVMRVPRGSVVDVLSMDGGAYVGALGVVDGSSLRVTVQGVEERIARGDVLRVDLVDLAGSEVGAVARQAGIGAALGVGAAAIVAGVIGGQAWPPPGALLRGGAAIGGVAGGQSALAARQPRLIYLAEHQSAPTPVPGTGYRRDPQPTPQVLRSLAATDWSAVTDLAPGSLVRVVRTNGAQHRGPLVAVDETSLRLDVDGAELHVRRTSIVRVEVLVIPDTAAARPSVRRRDGAGS
jgi:hypothetical protein